MTVPVPGKQYTVEPGDSLSLIAGRAYGDLTLWPRIWEANQTTLRSGDPDIISPGEMILIPKLPERAPPRIRPQNRNQKEMYVNLDGREVKPVSGRIIRSIDLVANAYSMTIPWEPGLDPDLDNRIAPYAYTPAEAFIGNDLIVAGFNYQTQPQIGQGTTVRISGYTPTADLVDSTLKPPFEFNNITLEDIITRIVLPLGFKAIFEVDTGGVFDRVTADQGDTVMGFLSGLARQREVLLSCDVEGNLVVTRAITTGVPVTTFDEKKTPGVSGWGATFDGRKRFNVYRAVGRSPLGEKEATVVDQKVPRTRFTTISADESMEGGIEGVARWARNRTLADALSFKLNVEGWYDPKGAPWRENTLVTVISPTMFLPDGFDFLINQVEYLFDSDGIGAVLSLVPPTVYTQGEIVEPW
ncbi:MAG: LysM peptidoglycan-binding domain-containing protein [Nitrospinaceae bacterium]